MSELIIAPDAPSAAGPYSPGVVVGDWIFLSGQGGFDPDTGELVSDTIAGQTTQAFRNVEVLLRAAGASLDDVVSCLVHLRDLAQFDEFNASYEQQFPGRVKPVRTTVGCDLVAGMRVEATVVARRPGRAASAVTPRGQVSEAVPASALPGATRFAWRATEGMLRPASLYRAAKIWRGRRSRRMLHRSRWFLPMPVTSESVTGREDAQGC